MQSQFPPEIFDRIERAGVIAVLVVDRVEHGPPLAEALQAGGIDAMELTLRTPAATDALKAIRRDVPSMLAGIGTVLTPEQVEQVLEADAAFGVAPGLNPRVVERAQTLGLPFAPGVATPSDIEKAVELGCRELKFFPAEPSGGMKYLSSMSAPYAHLGLRFIPLGGLNVENMGSYLAAPIVPAVGGSWIAPRTLIKQEDWPAITQNAAQATRMIDDLRRRETT
jgi:2-dehydro-3-deoxyphosphogluconate aldolase/(4S)-4-hydroxy-2-oxoglutarate aldolase